MRSFRFDLPVSPPRSVEFFERNLERVCARLLGWLMWGVVLFAAMLLGMVVLAVMF
ncbi:MAG TPA: hypothetical protein VFI38_05685 [Candidatus Acidoferrum sp.]|nr:hypothetical protein [Candidatus Acidoferrum sp.]